MTDIKLPAGYEDWVEMQWPDVRYADVAPMGRAYLRVTHELVELNSMGRYVGVQGETQYFVPPKPKPTLPDVKPGAVIRWTQQSGVVHRSVKLEGPGWHDYCLNVMIFERLHRGLQSVRHQTLKDENLLTSVDADGFTVELDGL